VRQVNLPPGCRSLKLEDGTRYVAPREGGRVTVTDDHARAIDRMPGNGTAGLVTGMAGFALGTKKGRWCAPCHRVWNAWSELCPRCGLPTEPEQERPVPADGDQIEMDEAAGEAWEAMSARPARDLPGLRRLMERPSPFA
jgi:hypothetical protein